MYEIGLCTGYFSYAEKKAGPFPTAVAAKRECDRRNAEIMGNVHRWMWGRLGTIPLKGTYFVIHEAGNYTGPYESKDEAIQFKQSGSYIVSLEV